MPYIQVDIEQGLSKAKKVELTEEIVRVVNGSIGSSVAHINVVLREWPAENLVEAGQNGRGIIGKNAALKKSA